MKDFGVSVYPDLESAEEIHNYLELVSRYGCKWVFSSMFSVEGTNEEILDYFRKLNADVHSFGMKIVLDVNVVFLKKLGVDCNDVSLFHEIGCDVMRMDGSYGAEGDLKLVQNPYGIMVMLNASSGAGKELDSFVKHNVPKDRVLLGHNFYPQPLTGLKWQHFLDTNKFLAPFGYPIQAFISSNNPDAGGVWDAAYGLPTVECLRKLPIDLQARILQASGNVDMLWIGNAFATEEELKSLQAALAAPRDVTKSPLAEAFRSYGLTMNQSTEDRKLKVIPEKDITEQEYYNLFDLYPQMDAGDSSEWIWRSRAGRLMHPSIPARVCDKKEFEVGDVLIVNNNYRHYAGEISVVRIPFENDGLRNLAGHLAPGEEKLLALIGDGDEVTFLDKTKE